MISREAFRRVKNKERINLAIARIFGTLLGLEIMEKITKEQAKVIRDELTILEDWVRKR